MTLTQTEPLRVSEADEWLLSNDLAGLYADAKTARQQYHSIWRRNYLLTINRQYTEGITPPTSPSVADSEVFPILSSLMAWMTDQRISFTVAPAASPNSPFATHQNTLAEHLEQLLGTAWTIRSWDQQILLSLWDAAQYGAGILKSTWDSGLSEGMGDVNLLRVDPWTFFPDPHATSFNDCNYMIEVHRMTFDEIERRFPGTSINRIRAAYMFGDNGDESRRPQEFQAQMQWPMNNPGNLPGSSGTVYGLPGQGRKGQSLRDAGVNVYECWVRENYTDSRESTDPNHPSPEPVVSDRWRVIVYTGNVILMDALAEDLWQESRHPYERFVFEEMGEFWPTPIVSHLAPCQIAVNRLLSAMQSNAELVGNPIFMDTANSGLGRTGIVNRPGQRLTLSQTATQSPGGKPDWLRPPEMSQLVSNMVQFWIERMENISGLSGVTKGQASPARQGAQTTQATQEAGFVRVRSGLRNLERTLGHAGELLANLIIQNYTIPRTVAIVGPDGTSSALALAARHFYAPSFKDKKLAFAPMRFSLLVSAGSDNPTSRQARIAEADALKSMNVIDDQAVLEAHRYPHWQQILQRKQQHDKEMAIAMAQAKGQGQAQPHGPGTGHEH